jgi:formylglycine-generating enzyme required for sulfatase activity
MKYYELLDVPPDATAEQIKAAYRILVQLHHPDRLQQAKEGVRQYAEEKLKKINEAYAVLSDPARRAQYDASLRQRARAAETYAETPDASTMEAWSEPPRRRRHAHASYRAAAEEWKQRETEQQAAARAEERRRRAEQERREAEARLRREAAERFPRVRVEGQTLRVHFSPGLWTALVRIPTGPFLMGSNPEHDELALTSECPQHSIVVSEFFIGQYPITNAQYQTYLNAARPKLAAPANEWAMPPGKETHPAVNVTWDDAVAFCQWLSLETGRTFRLPTEAEWEKAARGPDGWLYPWGNAVDMNCLNVEGLLGDTTPVGHFSPGGDSPFGVADMSGNVWEWCADWYAEKIYARRGGRGAADPQGPADGEGCVVRGGAFDSSFKQARAAHRNWYYPFNRKANLGFRIVTGSAAAI